jgi:hypothetical protein
MNMTTHSRSGTFPSAAMVRWLLNLATRLLARLFNMPEPLLHTTGVFVFVQVQTIENSIGRTLCPVQLLRRFHARFRRSAR